MTRGLNEVTGPIGSCLVQYQAPERMVRAALDSVGERGASMQEDCVSRSGRSCGWGACRGGHAEDAPGGHWARWGRVVRSGRPGLSLVEVFAPIMYAVNGVE